MLWDFSRRNQVGKPASCLIQSGERLRQDTYHSLSASSGAPSAVLAWLSTAPTLLQQADIPGKTHHVPEWTGIHYSLKRVLLITLALQHSIILISVWATNKRFQSKARNAAAFITRTEAFILKIMPFNVSLANSCF